VTCRPSRPAAPVTAMLGMMDRKRARIPAATSAGAAWVATRSSASTARQAMAFLTSARSCFSLLAFHLRSANDVGHIDPSSRQAVSLKPIEL